MGEENEDVLRRQAELREAIEARDIAVNRCKYIGAQYDALYAQVEAVNILAAQTDKIVRERDNAKRELKGERARYGTLLGHWTNATKRAEHLEFVMGGLRAGITAAGRRVGAYMTIAKNALNRVKELQETIQALKEMLVAKAAREIKLRRAMQEMDFRVTQATASNMAEAAARRELTARLSREMQARQRAQRAARRMRRGAYLSRRSWLGRAVLAILGSLSGHGRVFL